LQVYGAWLAGLIADPLVDTSALPSALVDGARFFSLATLTLFSGLFVAAVLSLSGPNATYKYQVQRLCFTSASLLLVFGQMHGTPGVVYQGLIWYFVPSSIVATNDIMAYFTGVACGR